MLRGRFTAIQAYLKKQEKSQINSLTLHLKQLEKEEMKNPRVSRRKEILKIRAEINAKETRDHSKNQQSQKLVRCTPLQYSCRENPHGQRSLAGYSPWGPKESDTTEQLSTAQHRVLISICVRKLHKTGERTIPKV